MIEPIHECGKAPLRIDVLRIRANGLLELHERFAHPTTSLGDHT